MQKTSIAMNEDLPAVKDLPLNRLSALLATDMAAVNGLILRNMQSDVALIPQLAQYLIAAGGKRIRPLLTLGGAQMYQGSMEKSYYLAAAVEFIHTATLLHDDVVDESFERRGQKSANLIFGNQASVLVGDFLFSKAFLMMVESGSLEILRVLSEASAIIAQGEVLQLSTTNDISTTMPAYMKVIESKTAALFGAACEIGPILGGAPTEDVAALRAYGMNIGIAFQIADDTLDYSADQAVLGKEIGDDFKEGKMTAPVIFAIQQASAEEKTFWQRTLGDKDQSEGDLAHAVELIRRHDALEQSHEMARKYARDAKASIARIPDCEIKEIFEDLADYTVTRKF
jgi:octaprenyl-diphosphate synthase